MEVHHPRGPLPLGQWAELQCRGTEIPTAHRLLAETQWCPGGMIIHRQEMITTTQRTATRVVITIPEIQETMDPLPEIILTESTPTPVPEMTTAQCQGATVTVMAMVVVGSPETTWIVKVVAPTEIPMMVTVTLAAPLPHGAPHHPMVGAVEAVVMMTMAAVPGMDMAVVTVTPAVGVTHTHLAVVSEWAGRKGAQLPLSREATLLVIHTAAQVVEGHAVAVVEIEPIEEWLAADTKMDLEMETKKTDSVHN